MWEDKPVKDSISPEGDLILYSCHFQHYIYYFSKTWKNKGKWEPFIIDTIP